MDLLPRDVLATILSKLAVKSLTRCRCVCKSWFNLTKDPTFIRLHLLHSSQQNPSLILTTTVCIDPLFYFRTQLLFSEDQSPCTRIGVDLSDHGYNEFRVLGSCNGLLCLINTRTEMAGTTRCFSIVVSNPCTGAYSFVINPLEQNYDIATNLKNLAFGFGFCPGSNDYKIVYLAFNPNPSSEGSKAFVYSLNEMNWREVGAPPFKVRRESRPEYLNGVLHWITDYSAIVTFSLEDELFGVIPCPVRSVHSVVVLNGGLSLVEFESISCILIWVLKDHGLAAESWMKSFTIDTTEAPGDFRSVRVLYAQQEGEIIMLFRNHVLASYDPGTKSFKRLRIAGLPSWFEATCLVGSLVPPPELQSIRRRGRAGLDVRA